MDHPLVSHKLTLLRSQDTTSPVFRQLVEELVTLLAYEATREVDVVPCTVTTPVTQARGVELASPKPLVVPILRAGLGMLEGMLRLIPSAEVGFVGMARDEETLQPMTYAERLPSDLSGRQCFVLDPMLATGGSLGGAVQFLAKRGAKHVVCLCILAAPEGIERFRGLVKDLGMQCTPGWMRNSMRRATSSLAWETPGIDSTVWPSDGSAPCHHSAVVFFEVTTSPGWQPSWG